VISTVAVVALTRFADGRFMRLRRDGWKGKANSGPEVGVRRRPHPAAMRFDDAAANRQTDAHAVCFCRERRIENSISILYAQHQTIARYTSFGRVPEPLFSLYRNFNPLLRF
jgi:hypothetical protein